MPAKKKSPEKKREDHSKKEDEMLRKAREIAEAIQLEAQNTSEEDILKDLPTTKPVSQHRAVHETVAEGAEVPQSKTKEEKEEPAEKIEREEAEEKNEKDVLQSGVSQAAEESREESHEEPVKEEEKTPRYDELLAANQAETPKEKKADQKKEERETHEEKKSEETSSSRDEKYKADMAFSSLFSNNDPDSKKKKLIWLFVVVVIVTVALASGAFYYASKNPSAVKLPTVVLSKPSPTPSPLPTATPTPTPPVMTSYSVEVLNGSGIAGEASKVSDLLKSGGFSNIKTGNASSYNFTKTEVQLGANTPSTVYDAINKALGNNYVVEQSSTPLPKTSTYDVVITVGSSKK